MSRRSRTFSIGLFLLFAGGLVAGLVQVPLVALGPGPTFDTLGEVDGKQVVSVVGRPTYPTSGHLNLTTVAVTDDLSALTALRFWVDPRREVVPRAAIYPPGKTDEQIEQENTQQFTDSETRAEVAALSYLKQPIKVVVDHMGAQAPAANVLQVGDQLLSVEGILVNSPAEVSQLLTRTRPGQQVRIGYRRGDAPVTEGVVTVGVRPPGPNGGTPDGPQGFLGIIPGATPVQPDEITISLGDIGGPSAGLAFALAVVDKLTPGELTGGRFVAGSGEIDPSGQVRRIGGIPLKMTAAKEAGATVFLVPADNCAEAAPAAPPGLQLIKVGTLTDAVDGLTALNQGRAPNGC